MPMMDTRLFQVVVLVYWTTIQVNFFIRGHECIHGTQVALHADIGEPGNVTSPNYPDLYRGVDNLCEVHIVPQCRYCKVRLDVLEFNNNCSSESLKKIKSSLSSDSICDHDHQCEYAVIIETISNTISHHQFLTYYESEYVLNDAHTVTIRFCYSQNYSQNFPWKFQYSVTRSLYKAIDIQDLPHFADHNPTVEFSSPDFPSERVEYKQKFYTYLLNMPRKTYTCSFVDYSLPKGGTIEVYDNPSALKKNLKATLTYFTTWPDVIKLENTTFLVFKPYLSRNEFVGFRIRFQVFNPKKFSFDKIPYGGAQMKPGKANMWCRKKEYGGVLKLMWPTRSLRTHLVWVDCVWVFQEVRGLSNYIKLIEMQAAPNFTVELRDGYFSTSTILWNTTSKNRLSQSVKRTDKSFYLRCRGGLRVRDSVVIAYALTKRGFCSGAFVSRTQLVMFDFPCKMTLSWCIPTKQVCDGYDHCGNGEDEATQNCAAITKSPSRCREFSTACDGGATCYSSSQRCDGVTQCMDGEDEQDCLYNLDRPEADKDFEVNLMDYWYLLAAFLLMLIIACVCSYRTYKRRNSQNRARRTTTDVDAGTPLNVLNYDSVRPFSTEPPDPSIGHPPSDIRPPSDATAPPPSYDEVVRSNIYELPANNVNEDSEAPPKYEFVADIGRNKAS